MINVKGLGSDLERAFDTQLNAFGRDLPKPEKDPFQFDPTRHWKIDRAWPAYKVGVELEGGQYGSRVICHNCGAVVRAIDHAGRPSREIRQSAAHGRSRFVSDREKYNAAQMLGWILLRFVHEDVIENPMAMIEVIRQALEARSSYVRPDGELLSPHQVNILQLIAGGLLTPDIAGRLNASDDAIRKQIQRIEEKLMVTNRPSAVARGMTLGIIDPARIPWAWETYSLLGVTGSISAVADSDD